MIKILVIDDDDLIRTTLRRMLQAAGYAVVEAVDGDDGLRCFENEQPDLVLADILMPNKEGIETIRELRRLSQSVAIIAMSGGVGTGDFRFLDFAGRLGADQVLRKPFTRIDLLKAIDGCLIRPA